MSNANHQENTKEDEFLLDEELVFSKNFRGIVGDPLYGFNILLVHLRNGEKSMEELYNYLKERHAVERNYVESLCKLKQRTLGTREQSGMMELLSLLKNEVDDNHQINSQNIKEIQIGVINKIKELRKIQKKTREMYILDSKKINKEYCDCLSTLERLEAKIERTKKDLEKKQLRHEKISNRENNDPKIVKSLQEIKDIQMEFKMSKSALKIQKKSILEIKYRYDVFLDETLNIMQKEEAKRLQLCCEYLKRFMHAYKDILPIKDNFLTAYIEKTLSFSTKEVLEDFVKNNTVSSLRMYDKNEIQTNENDSSENESQPDTSKSTTETSRKSHIVRKKLSYNNAKIEYLEEAAQTKQCEIPTKDEKFEDGSLIAIGYYDFEAKDENEISFKHGTRLAILNTFNDGWAFGYIVGKPDNKGLFPINYLSKV